MIGKAVAKASHLPEHLAMHQITISDAGDTDPSQLAAIRVEAMRPSLEAVGRFDPDRARNRFLDTYDPANTHILHAGNDVIGVFVVRTHPEHLYLDHIYIRPSHQACGLGRRIVHSVQDRARKLGLPVRLVAIHGSRANAFYRSCGFLLERSDDLDNYYVWDPT